MMGLIRHPVFVMDVACASEDTGARAFACPSGYQGIRRNDGNLGIVLPECIAGVIIK
jgi:hypothetical protein